MRHADRLAMLVGAFVPLAWVAAAPCAEPPSLATVTRFLGPEGKNLGGQPFADAVSRSGQPAMSVVGRATGWRQPAIAGAPWLCGLTAGFGERAHAYAFWFDAAGMLERFAHIPYGKTTLPGGQRAWFAPVDRLAAAVADAAGRQPLSGPPLGIRVLRAESDGDAGPVADMDVFEAIAWAAACEAGWMPAAASAANAATLGVDVGVKSVAFRLVVESGGRRRELVKRDVSDDNVHEVLRRMFACAMPNAVASDFLRLGAGNEVIRWRGGVASIEPATGGVMAIAPLQPAASWSFDLDGDRAVVASGRTLALFAAGRELWRHDEADAVTCGPAFAGRFVVAGTAEGGFVARSVDDGAVAWRQCLEPGLAGRIVAVGPRLVVYAREGDVLVAIATDTGGRVWSCPIGDVPLAPPVVTPAGLLVVTKSSRLLLLDPDTGRIRAERQLTGWVGDVAALPGRKGGAAARLVCLVRDGTVAVLDAGSLEPVAERSLPVRPGYGRAARLLVVPDFPVTWPGPAAITDAADALEEELQAELVATAECLLVADEEGYAWIVPTSRLMEGRP